MTVEDKWTLSSPFSGGSNDLLIELPTKKALRGLTVHRCVMMMRKRSFTPPTEATTRFHGGGEVSVRPSTCIRPGVNLRRQPSGRVQAASVSHSWKEALHEIV